MLHFSSPTRKQKAQVSGFILSFNLSLCKLSHLHVFLSKTIRSMSTKLGIKHLWVKEIQVHSNEGLWLFKGRKKQNSEKISSRIIWQFSIKFSTKHFKVEHIQIYSDEGSHPFPKGDNWTRGPWATSLHGPFWDPVPINKYICAKLSWL